MTFKKAIVTFVCIFILLLCISKWILYWIYYKPLYAIFGSNFYLPFYLYAASFLLLCLLFFFGSAYSLKKGHKIFMSCVLIFMFVISEKTVFQDFIFLKKEKYKTTECDLGSLCELTNTGGAKYQYTVWQIGNNFTGKNNLVTNMDFYQYRELLKEKEKIGGKSGVKILTVYYLPNTKRMLKYEYTN